MKLRCIQLRYVFLDGTRATRLNVKNGRTSQWINAGTSRHYVADGRFDVVARITLWGVLEKRTYPWTGRNSEIQSKKICTNKFLGVAVRRSSSIRHVYPVHFVLTALLTPLTYPRGS